MITKIDFRCVLLVLGLIIHVHWSVSGQARRIEIVELGIEGVLFDSTYRGIIFHPDASGLCKLDKENIIACENVIYTALSIDSLRQSFCIKKGFNPRKYTRQYYCEWINGEKIVAVLLMKQGWTGKPKKVFRGWETNVLHRTSESFRKYSRFIRVNLTTGELLL